MFFSISGVYVVWHPVPGCQLPFKPTECSSQPSCQEDWRFADGRCRPHQFSPGENWLWFCFCCIVKTGLKRGHLLSEVTWTPEPTNEPLTHEVVVDIGCLRKRKTKLQSYCPWPENRVNISVTIIDNKKR